MEDKKVVQKIEDYVKEKYEGIFKNKEVHIKENGSVYLVSNNEDSSPLIFSKSLFE